jgi:hypothetical protein
MQALVAVLVLTCLDYHNTVLSGITGQLLTKLQSILNAAARLIFRLKKYDHVTPLLHELHWLGYPERIDLKLAVLVLKCLHGVAPSYLVNEFGRVVAIEP